jgi:Flp pilus assembly protein TadD
MARSRPDGPMTEDGARLQVNPDIVQRLVDLARRVHAREYTSTPEDPEVQALAAEAVTLSEHRFDHTVDEFRSIIHDLDPRQQQEVVALFRLGRGDHELANWEEALQSARDDWNSDTAEYLLRHPMLADELVNGIEMHGHHID